jgi:hypothetical protein
MTIFCSFEPHYTTLHNTTAKTGSLQKDKTIGIVTTAKIHCLIGGTEMYVLLVAYLSTPINDCSTVQKWNYSCRLYYLSLLLTD